MLILTLRTDKPEAEIGLYDDAKQLAYETWEAHRQLSETIHSKLRDLLIGHDKDWQDIQGIVCFKGPGSFTGLRIGLTVGNSLATNLRVPIVSTQNDDWLQSGVDKLLGSGNEKVALPDYGRAARITLPKK